MFNPVCKWEWLEYVYPNKKRVHTLDYTEYMDTKDMGSVSNKLITVTLS